MDTTKPDPRLSVKGYDEYLKDAINTCREYNNELGQLMSQYGIEDEGDIACGCLNKVRFKKPCKFCDVRCRKQYCIAIKDSDFSE